MSIGPLVPQEIMIQKQKEIEQKL